MRSLLRSWRLYPVIFLITCSSASARTWHIRPDGTGDAPTIIAGIDSACAGDIVELACGTYNECNVVLKSGVILHGEAGGGCAVIDAQMVDRVFYGIDLDWSTRIENVVVKNGRALFGAFEPATDGGGLYCRNSDLRILNCAFVSNRAGGEYFGQPMRGYGGGVYCDGGSPSFFGCQFSGNVANSTGLHYTMAFGYGGAIYTSEASTAFAECVFNGNVAHGDGGAMYLAGSSSTLYDCTFTGNEAMAWWDDETYGGAVASSSVMDITHCEFIGNVANAGAGAVRCGGAENLFSWCVFARNRVETMTGGGGAISGSPTMVNCTVVYNYSSFAPAAIAGAPTMENCLVASNSCGVCYGGAIWDGVLSCCDVIGNGGGDWVGPLAAQANVNGNFSAWPLFCAPLAGNYYLSETSPCLALNSPCGVLTGALPRGCGPVALATESWARVKARYR